MKEKSLLCAYSIYCERLAHFSRRMSLETFRKRIELVEDIITRGVVYLPYRSESERICWPPLEVGLVALGIKPYSLLTICDHEQDNLPKTFDVSLSESSIQAYFQYFLDSKLIQDAGLRAKVHVSADRCLSGLGIFDPVSVSQVLKIPVDQVGSALDSYALTSNSQELFGYPQPMGSYHLSVKLKIYFRYSPLVRNYVCTINDPKSIDLEYLRSLANAVGIIAEILDPSVFWNSKAILISENSVGTSQKPILSATIFRAGAFNPFDWEERIFDGR